jgi:hypothetical protein
VMLAFCSLLLSWMVALRLLILLLLPLASPPVVLPVARGESVGLHCDHCG